MEERKPKRIAILPAKLGKLPLPAFEYLVLKLNTLQTDIQFEFLPIINVEKYFKNSLKPNSEIIMADFLERAPQFIQEIDKDVEKKSLDFKLSPKVPDRYVIFTLATNDKSFYHHFSLTKRYSAVFLGDWDNEMAPPSLLEFMLTMVMVDALTAIMRTNRTAIAHLPTRGCIADFNPELRDVRYKTLQGFLCDNCISILQKKIGCDATANWIRILEKDWIGKLSEHSSSASIVSKLGYNLFVTKGLTPTNWQKFVNILKEDGVKELIKLLGALILAALLVWLNLKK